MQSETECLNKLKPVWINGGVSGLPITTPGHAYLCGLGAAVDPARITMGHPAGHSERVHNPANPL